MLTQSILETGRGVRITVSDSNPREQKLIHSVLYGEPTADEVQRALEALTAFELGLAGVGELRRHTQAAMRQAMIIWNALQGVERV